MLAISKDANLQKPIETIFLFKAKFGTIFACFNMQKYTNFYTCLKIA